MTVQDRAHRVSVIIPTHNRRESLERTLRALCRQSYPFDLMEVIVVADGCHDDTSELLRAYTGPFRLHGLAQPKQGASTARNYGAATATGSTLIFIDDDVEPAPQLVEAHVSAHRIGRGIVGMGYLPVELAHRTDFLSLLVRSWWADQFQEMGKPSHRFLYRNLFSGNFSLDADLFRQVGGFDPSIPRREDYDLGMRLMKTGATFMFLPNAVGYHHEAADAKGNLTRARQEGRGDILMGFRHTELRPTFSLSRFQETQSLRSGITQALVFQYNALGDAIAALLCRLLVVFERLRLRRLWQRVFQGLRTYWYLRGVKDELKTRRGLIKYLQEGPAHSQPDDVEIDLDLSQGLELAERRLDEERPAGARIFYKNTVIGHLPPQVGAERLKGAHLRAILASDLSWPLLKILIMEQAREPFDSTLDSSTVCR